MDLATAANEVHNGVSEVVLLIPLDEVGMVMGKGGNVIKGTSLSFSVPNFILRAYIRFMIEAKRT